MPAIPPYLIEPIWEQSCALLPERDADVHPLGCHRNRVPDKLVQVLVFDKLVQVLVFGCAHERIADRSCSATTLRRRRDEWIGSGAMEKLRRMALEAYDHFTSGWNFPRWPSIAASPRPLAVARRREETR